MSHSRTGKSQKQWREDRRSLSKDRAKCEPVSWKLATVTSFPGSSAATPFLNSVRGGLCHLPALRTELCPWPSFQPPGFFALGIKAGVNLISLVKEFLSWCWLLGTLVFRPMLSGSPVTLSRSYDTVSQETLLSAVVGGSVQRYVRRDHYPLGSHKLAEDVRHKSHKAN